MENVMEWHKWTEIENLEAEKLKQSKAYQKALEEKCTWVVTEKIDGTNFGLNITPDDYQFNSRNQMLGKLSSFYNIYSKVDILKYLIRDTQKYCNERFLKQVTLQGEYFGQKVLNRIDYRTPYSFRFFGMYTINEDGYKIVYPFSALENFLHMYGHQDFLVPVLKRCSFEEAMKYPNNGMSTFNLNAEMEGIVIMPYSIPYNADGYDLIFKNKNEDFNERAKRGHKTPSDIPVEEIDRMKALKEMFKEYITESRMYSVISKIGKPSSEKEYGKYVNPFIEDAYKDFMKDNPELLLTDKERKFITNIGSNGFLLFSVIVSKLNNN